MGLQDMFLEVTKMNPFPTGLAGEFGLKDSFLE